MPGTRDRATSWSPRRRAVRCCGGTAGCGRSPKAWSSACPASWAACCGSGILSPRGVARAGLDLVLPRGRPPATLTVRELVADRFGAEVADRLVDPLVGGIHAGSTGDLGAPRSCRNWSPAADTVPQPAARPAAGAGAGGRRRPVFLAPRGGVGQLVDASSQSLQDAGTRFVATTVDAVRAGPAAVG